MTRERDRTAVMSVRSIRSTFGSFSLAIDGLELRSGLTCLVGPNGAGKTTLIRILAGEKIGQVDGHMLNGIPVDALGYRFASSVQVVRDALRAVEGLTVRQSLALARAAHGDRWCDERAELLIGRLGLTVQRRVRDLSRGNAVKLQFVLADACAPEVLLLDEPTAGLDPFIREEVLQLVAESVDASCGRAVLLATHLLDDVAIDATDRVIVLGDGRVQYMPSSNELDAMRAAPSRERAAHLLRWYPFFASHEAS